MSKDEALHKALKVLNCLNNGRVYETAWVKGAINACEEALEQEERTQRTMHCGTADAFIAMDDDHKRRWFVQSLRESKRRKELEDILEQPAQEPVACMFVNNDGECEEHMSWAEGLILQLPITHDGRNSWLLNHGKDLQAEWLRNNHAKLQELSSVEHTDYLTKSLQSIVDKSTCPNKPLADQAATIAQLQESESNLKSQWMYYQDLLSLNGFDGITDIIVKFKQLQLDNAKMCEALEDISKANHSSAKCGQTDYSNYAHAIEQALKEKNT